MANENETVMAVCAEWRDCIESADPSVWNDDRIAGLVKTTKAQQLAYLDRIDEAAKRDEERAVEHATRHAEAVARDNCRDCIHNPNGKNYEPVGNAAATREALEGMCKASQDVFCSFARETFYGERRLDSLGVAFDKAKAALAKPPRNCDMFAEESDAQIAFLNEVWLISVDRETMLERDKYENWTDEMRKRYGRWLLAPAAERKGEGDGR